MPLSSGQGGDISVRKRSAHKITVDPAGKNKTVGFTVGNTTITISPQTEEIMVAEFGTTPVDIDVTGVKVVVKWSMTERSLKTLDIALDAIYPQNAWSVTANRGIGFSGIKRASVRGKKIVLHPIDTSGTTEDITLNKALLLISGSTELSDKGSQVFDVEAHCIVDPTASEGEWLASIAEAAAGA